MTFVTNQLWYAGETDSKILMARTLARLTHMPDTSKRAASTRDSIFTLTNMMNSAKEEEVDSAIAAVKNLSGVTSVCSLIAECSGLEVCFTSDLFVYSLVHMG